jgi:hypothetical protein
MATSNDDLQLSPEARARYAKSARQLAAYVTFIRWTVNFKRDEITRHPRHDRVLLLSPMQSSRFSFATEDETLLLGVQPFEAAWLTAMPFDCLYVADRLYLTVEGVACMNAVMPTLSLGIFVDDTAKLSAMAACKFVQPTHVTVDDGRVATVGQSCGDRFRVKTGDVIKQLAAADKAKLSTQDASRFF